jgi:hypothetical protein
MKGLAIILTVFVAGCSSLPKSQPNQLSSSGSSKPIHTLVAETLMNPPKSAASLDYEGPYLSSPEDQQARIEKFLKNHPNWVEREKIVYLFESIKKSPNTFVRNGVSYTGPQAARFLRWKMGRGRFTSDPVHTAREFVERVCSRSSMSRQPYEMVLPDASRYHLKEILAKELASLEAALAKSAAQTSLTASASEYEKPSESKIQMPALIPSTPGSAPK